MTAENNGVEKKNRLGRRLKVEMRSMEQRKEQPGVLQAELVDVGSETCMGSNSPFFWEGPVVGARF